MHIDDIYFIYNMICLMYCQIHIGAATARCFQDVEGFHSMSLSRATGVPEEMSKLHLSAIFLYVDVL